MQIDGYDFESEKGIAGQKYDLRPDVVRSFAAETNLAFGKPVQRGTDPEKQVVLADDDAFLGIALFSHTIITDGYVEKDTVSVLMKGAAYVEVSVAVTAGETAYVTAAGLYTNVVGTNLKVGTFITSAGLGELAVLEI